MASHQFEKEANFWWATVKPQAGQPQLMWQQFKDLLDEKYYPNDVKWAKEQEFLHLKQGKTMSVMEYATKFKKLSQFAPTQVATE